MAKFSNYPRSGQSPRRTEITRLRDLDQIDDALTVWARKIESDPDVMGRLAQAHMAGLVFGFLGAR